MEDNFEKLKTTRDADAAAAMYPHVYKAGSLFGEKLVWVCEFSAKVRTFHETEDEANEAFTPQTTQGDTQ